MKKIAIEKESLKSLDVISLQSNLLFMKKKLLKWNKAWPVTTLFKYKHSWHSLLLKSSFVLCNKDKDQRVRFNLRDEESSSQQNHLCLQTTFSLIRQGQFYHKYVKQRQKAENQPKQNTENKSTNCQKTNVLII